MTAFRHTLRAAALTLTLGVAGVFATPAFADHEPSFGIWLTHGGHHRDRHYERRRYRDRHYDRRYYRERDYRHGFYAPRHHRRHYRAHRDWIRSIRRPGIYFLEPGHWGHYYYVDERYNGYCYERGRHSHGSLHFSW